MLSDGHTQAWTTYTVSLQNCRDNEPNNCASYDILPLHWQTVSAIKYHITFSSTNYTNQVDSGSEALSQFLASLDEDQTSAAAAQQTQLPWFRQPRCHIAGCNHLSVPPRQLPEPSWSTQRGYEVNTSYYYNSPTSPHALGSNNLYRVHFTLHDCNSGRTYLIVKLPSCTCSLRSIGPSESLHLLTLSHHHPKVIWLHCNMLVSINRLSPSLER